MFNRLFAKSNKEKACIAGAVATPIVSAVVTGVSTFYGLIRRFGSTELPTKYCVFMEDEAYSACETMGQMMRNTYKQLGCAYLNSGNLDISSAIKETFQKNCNQSDTNTIYICLSALQGGLDAVMQFCHDSDLNQENAKIAAILLSLCVGTLAGLASKWLYQKLFPTAEAAAQLMDHQLNSSPTTSYQ